MANENEKELFFVIDGEIVFNLITDERLSAVLRSEPVVVELTPELGDRPHLGDKWDGTKIIRQEK
jgi:hypothetical protein